MNFLSGPFTKKELEDLYFITDQNLDNKNYLLYIGDEDRLFYVPEKFLESFLIENPFNDKFFILEKNEMKDFISE